MAPALIALDAKLNLARKDAERRIPVNEFFLHVNRTVLEPGELIISIEFPHLGAGAGSAFLKLGRRNALSLAVVNAAAYLEQKDGVITNARIAVGAVAPTPLRVTEAEQELIGKEPEKAEGLFARVAGIVKSAARPISDARASKNYRLAMTEVFARRVIECAWERATNPEVV
jgi:carbon-monoxide dehydrogenase medium subunit